VPFEFTNILLVAFHTEHRCAVVWAHNSHVGNAAATDMGRARDEINIGQLCREKFGDDATLIGFGIDRGTVAAADDWDGPMRTVKAMSVYAAMRASGVSCLISGRTSTKTCDPPLCPRG
jgi:erythromycin esterase-like protein